MGGEPLGIMLVGKLNLPVATGTRPSYLFPQVGATAMSALVQAATWLPVTSCCGVSHMLEATREGRMEGGRTQVVPTGVLRVRSIVWVHNRSGGETPLFLPGRNKKFS